MIIIYLIFDILMTTTIFKTNLYLAYLGEFKLKKNNVLLTLISLIPLIFYTRNIIFLLTIPLILILKKYKYFHLVSKPLKYLINYLLFFNIHLSLKTFLFYLFSLLFYNLCLKDKKLS